MLCFPCPRPYLLATTQGKGQIVKEEELLAETEWHYLVRQLPIVLRSKKEKEREREIDFGEKQFR